MLTCRTKSQTLIFEIGQCSGGHFALGKNNIFLEKKYFVTPLNWNFAFLLTKKYFPFFLEILFQNFQNFSTQTKFVNMFFFNFFENNVPPKYFFSKKKENGYFQKTQSSGNKFFFSKQNCF
jgi:hypothetical protein